MDNFRPPAIPLATIDPYFSIWSMTDNLYDDVTRHWTGIRNNLYGFITIDGDIYKFMGKLYGNGIYHYEPDVIEQINVKVLPLKTVYTFRNNLVELTLTFMSPCLPDDLHLLSRPVSYIVYDIKSMDGVEHDIEINIGINAECCVKDMSQKVIIEKTQNGLCCGNALQKVLSESKDKMCVNWGYVHIFAQNHDMYVASYEYDELYCESFNKDSNESLIGKAINLYEDYAYLMAKKACENIKEMHGFVCLGYDDVHSIEYLGETVDAYYKKDGVTFCDAMTLSIKEFDSIYSRVNEFDDNLIKKARAISDKYAEIVSLAFRQVMAAHKLTWDGDEHQFFSKECYSNGCIGTVDITYPSIPMFLVYNPDLVIGMLNPIFKYAKSPAWEFDSAPHDVGKYPFANGLAYGINPKTKVLHEDMLMPVEECGNMIISVAAVCYVKNDYSYYQKHRDILLKWVNYLKKYGLDPENQLCTDDFAGHLAHNSNLAIKAIVGLGAFGKMESESGGDGSEYISLAKEYAKEWKIRAYNGECYKLAYNQDDSWSIKYNLVWDKLLGLNIFDKDIFKAEIAKYKKEMRRYGLPLDSRSDYTKTDWQVWSTILDEDDIDYRNIIIDKIWDMLNETSSRVPFTDWYYTSTAIQRGFQHRSVLGAIFINML